MSSLEIPKNSEVDISEKDDVEKEEEKSEPVKIRPYRYKQKKIKFKRCICDTKALLKRITGQPILLSKEEINNIRLNLFTHRNSDRTEYLVLHGRDIFEKYGRRITDNDIPAICRYIREKPKRITKLDLCYNEITDLGFFRLLKKLLIKGRSSIINLNIMNNELTEESMRKLSIYATYIKLIYLRINGNHLGTQGGLYITEFLKYNETVQYLDIGQTGQTLHSVAPIITALRSDHGDNETVKVLDFSRVDPVFNRYPVESKWIVYHIELLLERNSTIVELHLQKNELIGHDMEYIVRGLERNSTLKYLDLGYNRIGNYGAEVLAKHFDDKSKLILLNLAGNSISDPGAIALSMRMPFGRIRALDVSSNHITDTGLICILHTLKKSFYLRFFNIWGNKIGHPTCVIIDRMLLSGALFQHTIDVKIYEVDNVLYAAYYPNPADRNKHIYYCELDYAIAMPIYHIKRNVIEAKSRGLKVDCKQRHWLHKTDKENF